MATGKKLHELVLSLSPNEKRHFRLKGSVQSGKRNYLLLFDALEQLTKEAYSRDALTQALKGKLPIKDLHVTENYLYQRILESLRAYHEQRSIDAQLFNQLHNAAILENKGLYELSVKMLSSARKTVEKSSCNSLLIEILKRQARNIAAMQTQKLQEKTDAICNDLVVQAKLLKEEAEYFSLNQTSFVRYRKWKLARHQDEKQFVHNILKNKLIKNKPSKGSFYAQYLRHNTRNNCYSLLGQFEDACSEVEQIVQLWNANTKIKHQQLSLYIIQLSNLINQKNKLKDFEAVTDLLAQLKNIKTKTYDEKAEQFQNYYFQKLAFHLNQLDFPSILELIPTIEAGLATYKDKINRARRLAFYYNITVAYFISECYEKVIHWLFKIQKIQRINEPRKDIQQFSRILYLAICYKIQTDEGLKHLLKSAYQEEQNKDFFPFFKQTATEDLENVLRRIDRKNDYVAPLHSFEKIVLKYFKILLGIIPGSREEKHIFKMFKTELLALSEEQKKVLGFEEFLLWIDLVYTKSTQHHF
ncbi:hypothetical protein [Aureispira anguillae]|uniref:Uncharacterized protein n=1 Tax=Aureispira anguillae TaxID=2864201 RepID=A0A915YFZ7_9BACT|nr:hypothetical protein [Aureispira anguillae]BDS12452.1 hypothetical protein AsAng_0031750 [Aureispira anguillae]